MVRKPRCHRSSEHTLRSSRLSFTEREAETRELATRSSQSPIGWCVQSAGCTWPWPELTLGTGALVQAPLYLPSLGTEWLSVQLDQLPGHLVPSFLPGTHRRSTSSITLIFSVGSGLWPDCGSEITSLISSPRRRASSSLNKWCESRHPSVCCAPWVTVHLHCDNMTKNSNTVIK